MRRGKRYETLELAVRAALLGVMNCYEVDVTNSFFIDILDKVVKENKEGKQIVRKDVWP